MKTIRNIITIIAAVTGFFGLLTLILILAGFRPFILKTASMEPVYRKGSLCWIDTNTRLDSVSVGDTLVYRAPSNTIVLHRLVAVQSVENDNSLIIAELQGDANSRSQQVILSKTNFIGREAFTIPKLGSVVEQILSGNKVWFFIALFFILGCIPWESVRKRRRKTDLKETSL